MRSYILFLVHPIGMYSSYWTGFLSDQFRKVKVVLFLPYFIPANQIEDLFLWKTDLSAFSQCHYWIDTSCNCCRFLLVRFYEWMPFFTLCKGVDRQFSISLWLHIVFFLEQSNDIRDVLMNYPNSCLKKVVEENICQVRNSHQV